MAVSVLIMSKQIAILGSTGSIGTNALRVIDSLGADYEVAALSAHNNIELLAEQVKKYRPEVVAVTNPEKSERAKELLANLPVEILTGPDGLVEIARHSEIDTVIAAVVGSAGLKAILAAAEKGKTIAIANKEPLVIAGELLTETARANSATILPVDSEHSAVFQAMHAGCHDEVSRIILTASGGPFRGASEEQMKNVTVDDALDHPTWSMGPKITVDSATMINKALEVIEARWLFDIDVEKIDILVHPESIVHSMVEFVDGSVIAQLSTTDMCLPIQYALTFPRRVKGITSHLRLEEIGKLTFEKPNLKLFRSLKLGYEVAEVGGTAPAVFNAANEAAVEEFIQGRIKFVEITELIEYCLSKHNVRTKNTLEELLEADAWARNEVNEWIKQKV